MQHLKLSLTYFILIIVIYISCISYIECQGHWPNLKWVCKDGMCQREFGKPTELIEQSPITCRLNCDKFGALWPRPTEDVYLSRTVVKISPDNIKFDLKRTPKSLQSMMGQMDEIFIENLKKDCGENCSKVSYTHMLVELKVTSLNDRLTWTTDESYSLDLEAITGDLIYVQITAPTIFGARHGLESLTQLMTRVHTSTGPVLIVLTSATIHDEPVYPHRGLMLDTARHFLPVSAILRSIDGMAASKMNVLHWHATDSQSFPMVFPSLPQLSSYGAYSKAEKYYPSAVRYIIKYARLRGIRVIIELDAPAHVGAGWQWGKLFGHGNLVVCWDHENWRDRCIQPPCGQLNPANPMVFKYLKRLYQDIARWIPEGEHFHMGGDEVYFPCWNNTEEIVRHMKSLGLGRQQSDFLRYWAQYQKKALKMWDEATAKTHGSERSEESVIIWSSHLTTPHIAEFSVPKERSQHHHEYKMNKGVVNLLYVIQTWVKTNDHLIDQLLMLGYRVIISTLDAWYLDHGFWGDTKYSTWKMVYNNQLPKSGAVLGGETCMWTEYVDEYSIDSRVWPRTAAAAERLWTNPSTGPAQAEFRFNSHRERLINRGVRPEATTPEFCQQNDGKCINFNN